MDARTLYTDESAVSQVIGVVLMVGITVLLAATAGTFFMGIGDEQPDKAPQVAVQFDYENPTTGSDSLTVVHNGGDTVPAAQLEIVVTGASDGTGTIDARKTWAELGSYAPQDDIAAGQAVVVDASTLGESGLDLEGATVEVVWVPADGSRSFTLGTW
jgi:FlaG/FlaF family flagellin (archaellin)